MDSSKYNIVAVIPARMGSSRFPGKPLKSISGLSMIEHVRRRTELCPIFNQVLVATCDQEICDEVAGNGGSAIMTADTHETCIDRVAEAVASLDADIVANVQGDMPLVQPNMLEDMIRPFFSEADLLCTDMISPIRLDAEFKSPNVVKVAFDNNHNALYYSREPIPSPNKAPKGFLLPKFKQLGVMAFRSNFLQTFTQLPRMPLETVESVDMLRALEHGYRVRMVSTDYELVGVDVPGDLDRVQSLMQIDPLFPRYHQTAA